MSKRSSPAKPIRIVARHYATDETQAFTFQGSTLLETQPAKEPTDLLFGPGFFDLQCNGYAGVDFNDPEMRPEDFRRAISTMWQHGCTLVLPTVITHTPERIEQLLANLAQARAQDQQVADSVPGFHLEGPFISPVEGARGAHPKSAICPASEALWERWQDASGEAILLVTLAPEIRGALPLIDRLADESIIVALGHTMATTAQVSAAAEAGALLSTHLGNGCPQTMPRHTNPMLAQAGEDRLYASLIADGVHLPPEVLRTLARAKEPDRTILVTDAMAAAGAPPGRYRLAEMELEVGADRVVRLPGAANFAGSALTMDRAVAGLRTMAGWSWEDAWNAASRNPWQLTVEADANPNDSMDPMGLVIARPVADSLQIIATLRDDHLLWAEWANPPVTEAKSRPPRRSARPA